MAQVLLWNQYLSFNKKWPEYGICRFAYQSALSRVLPEGESGVNCKIEEFGIFDMDDVDVSGPRHRCGLPEEKIRAIISREKPSIVGIGCTFTRHYPDVLNLAKLVKETDQRIKIVLGGNHASVFTDKVLENLQIDFVVVGEGERTLHELCTAILAGRADYRNIALTTRS